MPILDPPKLNQIEIQQNKTFFTQFLKDRFKTAKIPEALIASLLDSCEKHGIWLPGLSPIVQNRFITILTLAITQQPTNALNIIFNTLLHAIQEERNYLQSQFAKHGGNQNQSGFQLPIANHEGQYKSVRSHYWLQAEDITAATQALSHISKIFVHPPIAKIDNRINATVTDQLQTSGAEVAYVPVSYENGHWMLEIYTTQNGTIKHQHYDPPGDGKCGDHVVNQMYTDASSRGLYEGHIGLTGLAETTQIRKQTIAIITDHNLVKKSKPADNSDTITQPHHLFGRSTFKQLCDEWNQRANIVIDRIQNSLEKDRIAEWTKFTQAAEKQGVIDSSSPKLGTTANRI